MKYLLLIVTIVTSISFANAQSPDSRPFLIAAQVRNLDQSIAWYTSMLDFKLIDKKSFPDYGMKIGMLQRDGFQLELVENVKTRPKDEVLKKIEAEEITGFAKVAFHAGDIRGLYKKLQDKKADFKLTLRDSNLNGKEQFFVVTDPDGNWVQFVGQK